MILYCVDIASQHNAKYVRKGVTTVDRVRKTRSRTLDRHYHRRRRQGPTRKFICASVIKKSCYSTILSLSLSLSAQLTYDRRVDDRQGMDRCAKKRGLDARKAAI